MIKKIINTKKLSFLRKKNRKKKVVLAHGVFDILHLGHINYFKEAKSFGDVLVVSVTSDQYVKKGLNRPYFKHDLRMKLLSELSIIDYVVLSDAPSSIDIIKSLKPNFYVKGPDYKIKNNDKAGNLGPEEKEVVKNNGLIKFTSGELLSSTRVLNYSFEKFNILSTIKKNNKLSNININQIYDDYQDCLKKIKNEKIIVIGEIILDNYLYSETLGMPSKENIISVKYEHQKNFIGGAIPVALTISQICNNVTFVSYFNKKNLKNKIENVSKNINYKLFYDEKFVDIKKNRFIDLNTKKKFFEYYNFNNQEFDNKKLYSYLSSNIKKFDKVIVCDFGHGLFSKNIINLLQKKSKILCLNIQTNSGNRGYNLFKKYQKSDMLALDEPEIRLGLQNRYSSLDDIVKSEDLKKFKDLVITRGIKGLLIKDKKSKKHYLNFPAFVVNAIDTMGAGDAAYAYASMFLNHSKSKLLIGLISSIAGAIKTTIIGHENIVNKEQVERTLESILKI